MQRKDVFAIGEFYHLYNRGVDKRDIFLTESDYHRFQLLLYLSNSLEPVHMGNLMSGGKGMAELYTSPVNEPLVAVGVYCLMPNHFHILVKEITEGGISRFMKKISTAYSMYFNKKNERTGTLFEGKFKGKRVDKNEYLSYLYSYIHLNPVKLIDPSWKENGIQNKKNTLKYLNQFRFSSYLDYQNLLRPEKNILNKDVFPEYFDESTFEEVVNWWLSFSLKEPNTEDRP